MIHEINYEVIQDTPNIDAALQEIGQKGSINGDEIVEAVLNSITVDFRGGTPLYCTNFTVTLEESFRNTRRNTRKIKK